MRRYWVNTVCRQHVLMGMEGGFLQADHGKDTRIRKLQRGDVVAFYSPRTALQGGDPLQCFTALGCVEDEQPFQVQMGEDFFPWRRKVLFWTCQEASIHPLLSHLSFIKDKTRWGFPFRRGLFEIEQEDLKYIAEAMSIELEAMV
ncbi:MAG: EVE domain-containing protein [Myxococcales bacterium]|nr:EVE domain-containing protein [Myxococcales bacterium]MCB9644942.1 EVE domain-containing protein [Myxococcales bacterium]